MMLELMGWLGFHQENSSTYYPNVNGKVEAIDKGLKNIIYRISNKNKSNWNIMLSPTLWAYKTSVNTATDFTPFFLVYGVEEILPIGCKIHLLNDAL